MQARAIQCYSISADSWPCCGVFLLAVMCVFISRHHGDCKKIDLTTAMSHTPSFLVMWPRRPYHAKCLYLITNTISDKKGTLLSLTDRTLEARRYEKCRMLSCRTDTMKIWLYFILPCAPYAPRGYCHNATLPTSTASALICPSTLSK